jgi:formamidopyrimidine-DNA glycosylase
VENVPPRCLRALFKAIKQLLAKGVCFGGDSMSDYRNVHGEKGAFQLQHHAYQKTGEKCDKKGCGGTIIRIKLGGRGTHFCDKHQKMLGN